MASRGDALQRPDSGGVLDRRGRTRLLSSLLWLVALALGVHTYLLIAGTPVSFDGAMNLQVAAALADGQGYGRFYDHWQLFPREIQTNAPYILPAALVFAVFGVTFETAQWTSIAYLAGLVFMTFLLGRRLAGTVPALIACILVLMVPELHRLGANGYGEVPALFWLLSGLFVLHDAIDGGRNRAYFLTGLCLGLAVLTKTVMLMPVGVVVALFGGAFLMSERVWRQPFLLACGGVCPIFAWEAWKLWSFGNLGGWLGWWRTQADSVLKQAGVSDGFQDSPSWTEKLAAHAEVLAGSLGLPIWLLPLIIIVPLGLAAVALLRARRDGVWRGAVLVPLMLAACIGAYLTWWLLVTPTEKAWYRRILIAVLLLALSAPLLPALAAGLRGRLALTMGGIASSALLLAGSLARFESVDLAPDTRERSTRAVVRYMQAAPESARFYGYRWYSEGVFGLYSGRRIFDLDKRKYWLDQTAGPHFFLVDGYAHSAGVAGDALEHVAHEVVLDSSDWGRIIRLDQAYRPPSPDVPDGVALKAVIGFLEHDEAPVTGMFAPQREGWRWAEPEAAIALLSTEAESLRIAGFLPRGVDYRYAGPGSGFGIRATVAGCELQWQYPGDSGRFTVEWPLGECDLPPSGEPVIVTLRSNAILTNSQRPLSWIVHEIALSQEP